MSDQPIDVHKELTEANARLPINVDREMPLDVSLRTIALTIAQRHVGDTCIKEGNLYQQVKMDNKLGDPVSVEHVIRAALVFERYLWGEWSKGIAENALENVSTEVADALEQAFKDTEPTRPSSGGDPA